MKVPIEKMHQLVRLLANQVPVRYYLRAGSQDRPYSHMRLEVWWYVYDTPSKLVEVEQQMASQGWTEEPQQRRKVVHHRIRYYIAEREWKDKDRSEEP